MYANQNMEQHFFGVKSYAHKMELYTFCCDVLGSSFILDLPEITKKTTLYDFLKICYMTCCFYQNADKPVLNMVVPFVLVFVMIRGYS